MHDAQPKENFLLCFRKHLLRHRHNRQKKSISNIQFLDVSVVLFQHFHLGRVRENLQHRLQAFCSKLGGIIIPDHLHDILETVVTKLFQENVDVEGFFAVKHRHLRNKGQVFLSNMAGVETQCMKMRQGYHPRYMVGSILWGATRD